MDNQDTSGLSAAETAYFESGGETEITNEPVVETVTETQPVEKTAEETTQTEQPADRDEKGRFVPHQALHAEREEHKRTKSELQAIRERIAVSEDRWNTLLKAGATEAKAEDVPPDPNEDIFAYSKWQKEQFDKLSAKINERDQADAQAKQAQEQENAIWDHWNQSVNQYATEKADFKDAAEYLSGLRTKQLEALGLSKADINRTINTELKGAIIQAAQLQKSPAEFMYNYALNSGYTPKTAEVVTDPAKLELPENLARIAAAQEQSKTLGNASGRAGGDEMTAEALLSMPAKEFDKWATENAASFRRLMGG